MFILKRLHTCVFIWIKLSVFILFDWHIFDWHIFLHTTIGKFTAALIKLCCEKLYLLGLYDRIITLQIEYPCMCLYLFTFLCCLDIFSGWTLFMHVAIIITIKNNRQIIQCVLCHLIPYFFPIFFFLELLLCNPLSW